MFLEILKGDLIGHAFRGNRWTGGLGSIPMFAKDDFQKLGESAQRRGGGVVRSTKDSMIISRFGPHGKIDPKFNHVIATAMVLSGIKEQGYHLIGRGVYGKPDDRGSMHTLNVESNIKNVKVVNGSVIPRQERKAAYEFISILKGGAGSGNFGHEGRPGEVGGSSGAGFSYDAGVSEYRMAQMDELHAYAPLVAPHEEKEINMMRAGVKPAAVILNTPEKRVMIKKEGWPYVLSHGYIVVGTSKANLDRVVSVWKSRPFTDERHRELGAALGYSNEEIEHFVNKGKTAYDFISIMKEEKGHPFRGNQYTGGIGGESKANGLNFGLGSNIPYARLNSIVVTNFDRAVELLAQGKVVELKDTKEVNTLINKLAEMVQKAKEKGEKAPNYDLCKVSVAGTNFFCGSQIKTEAFPNGIPRVNMPQFSGEPVKGTPADKLSRVEGSKNEVDASKAFMAHIKSLGIESSKEEVKSESLKASQNELVGAKVAKMMNNSAFDRDGVRIFVSRDNYIIDGHHRWAASIGKDAEDGKMGGMSIKVHRIDSPIAEILDIAKNWSGEFGIKSKAGATKADCGCDGRWDRFKSFFSILKGDVAGHAFRGNQYITIGAHEYHHGIERNGDHWVDKHGVRLPDDMQARLKSMGTAPAWKDVHLSVDEKAPLQVKGEDAKGTWQYKYSLEHSAEKDIIKFQRFKDFDAKIGEIREQIAGDMSSTDSKKADAAAVLSIIDKTGFRVGGEKDTKTAEKHYGISNLNADHISVKGNEVSLSFLGKSGKDNEKTIRDTPLANYLNWKLKSLNPSDRVFQSTDSYVRKYMSSFAKGFSPKDFRTWHGTSEAIKRVDSMPAPRNEKEYKAAVNAVGDHVSQHLGNTRAVALSSYIDPMVFERWRVEAKVTKSDKPLLEDPHMQELQEIMDGFFASIYAGEPRDWKSLPSDDEYPEDNEVPFAEVMKGGQGSGNFGHAGRLGEVGGSAAGYPPDTNPLARGPAIDVAIQKYLREGKDSETKYDKIDGQVGRYVAEREAKQHELVKAFFDKAVANGAERGSKAIIMGGPFGAGKTTTLRGMAETSAYITISPDDMKEVLAHAGMIENPPGLHPMEASSLIHEESSKMAWDLAQMAEAQKYNIIWDISMGNSGTIEQRIDDMKAINSEYKTLGIFVDVPISQSKSSAAERYANGLKNDPTIARYTQPVRIEALRDPTGEYQSVNRAAFEESKDHFDRWVLIDNTNYAHRVEAVSGPDVIDSKGKLIL